MVGTAFAAALFRGPRRRSWSVGIAALNKQVSEAGLEPVYVLEVPPADTDTRRLGPLPEAT